MGSLFLSIEGAKILRRASLLSKEVVQKLQVVISILKVGIFNNEFRSLSYKNAKGREERKRVIHQPLSNLNEITHQKD